MARLFTSGFEMNTNTAAVEFTSTTGSPTIQTSTVRTGKYAGEITSLVSGTPMYWRYQYRSAAATTAIFARWYIYITAYPNAATGIAAVWSSTTNDAGGVQLQTNGALKFFDNNGTLGGTSSVLSLNTWHLVEHKYDDVNAVVELKVDGSTVGTITSAGTLSNLFYSLGGNTDADTATSGTWFFDDWAINDTTGSSQTGYAGAGSVLRYSPSAAGDSNTFATQTGGTAGSANNFTRVNETTPDDATTFNGDSTTTHIDLYAVSGQNGSVSGTITLVQLNFRFRASTASALPGIKVEVEKTTGGTKSVSTIFTPNSTTWKTNTNAAPNLPPVTAYNDPDGSAWTTSTIGTMQIGILTGTGSGTTNRADVSNVWANVEFVPAAAANNSSMFLALMGAY